MRGALLGSALLGNTLLRHSTRKWVRSSFYTNWGNLMPFCKASDGHSPKGIIWTLFTSLENLDFADDLALVLHTHQRMQEKTTQLWTYAQLVGLNISQKKTEVMLLNVSNPTTEQVNGEDLPAIVEFPYLGSTVRHDGGAGSDIKNRLNKTRNTFGMHSNVWRSSQYNTKMKLRIYQNFVLSTLLYGSEYWRKLENDIIKLSVLHREMFCAWHHLQPTATSLLQSRQHGDHHYEKVMEMDWKCHEKRPGQQHTRSPSLDTRGGSAKEGVQKHLVPNCWGGAQDLEAHLLFNSQASSKPSDVDILRSCPTCHKA